MSADDKKTAEELAATAEELAKESGRKDGFGEEPPLTRRTSKDKPIEDPNGVPDVDAEATRVVEAPENAAIHEEEESADAYISLTTTEAGPAPVVSKDEVQAVESAVYKHNDKEAIYKITSIKSPAELAAEARLARLKQEANDAITAVEETAETANEAAAKAEEARRFAEETKTEAEKAKAWHQELVNKPVTAEAEDARQNQLAIEVANNEAERLTAESLEANRRANLAEQAEASAKQANKEAQQKEKRLIAATVQANKELQTATEEAKRLVEEEKRKSEEEATRKTAATVKLDAHPLAAEPLVQNPIDAPTASLDEQTVEDVPLGASDASDASKAFEANPVLDKAVETQHGADAGAAEAKPLASGSKPATDPATTSPSLMKRWAGAVKGIIKGRQNINPDLSSAPLTPTYISAQSDATSAKVPNTAQLTLDGLKARIVEAIDAYNKQYPTEKIDYKISDRDRSSFTLHDNKKHESESELALIKMNPTDNSITYRFHEKVGLDLADIILRSSQDRVLTLHSSSIEDITSILTAEGKPPNSDEATKKIIKLDEPTKQYLKKQIDNGVDLPEIIKNKLNAEKLKVTPDKPEPDKNPEPEKPKTKPR